MPEWQKTLTVRGGEADVERFVKRAAQQLGAPLEATYKGGAAYWRLHAASPPRAVRERLDGEGLAGTLRIDFHQPPAPGTRFIHRTHPRVAVLADYLLETALDDAATENTAALDAVARVGAIFTSAVDTRTSVLRVRLRHQLTVTHRGESRLLLCEETLTVGLPVGSESSPLEDAAARVLMTVEPARNMPSPGRDQHIQPALAQRPAWQPPLEGLARARAQQLVDDHRRVRAASDARGEYRVTPSLPVDVMGVYVLIPA